MTGRLRRWWAARSLRLRITLVVGGVALVALLTLSRLGAGLLYGTLLDAADTELRGRAEVASVQVAAGERPGDPAIRVLDTAGGAVDGAAAPALTCDQVRRLAAGQAVFTEARGELRRWVAVPAVPPDGAPRLVVASADLVGAAGLLRRGSAGFLLGALPVAGVVALAAWAATRAALRPVHRMRVAAAALPAGGRLPLPPARDELRELAEEINSLLRRRDEAVMRLERFTGDAAHELRSPVAAIRAQAEVALEHPDPELAGQALSSIAAEARRLTDLLAVLLALARADAGRRPPARPVDLAGAAAAAVGRGPADDPASRLDATGELVVAAGTAEVDLVVENLLANARRHARSRVGVAVLPAGAWVRLVVDDDGPGIPEADRERVFDRFTRLDGGAVDPEAGAGLGLALVAALVRGRGGTVRVGEAPGGGARVEVRWPAAPGDGAVGDPPDGPGRDDPGTDGAVGDGLVGDGPGRGGPVGDGPAGVDPPR